MIRALTIEEMIELPEGAFVVLTEQGAEYFDREYRLVAGSTLTRERHACDDSESVGFSFYDEDGMRRWEYLSHGEVGIEETQATKERTLLEGMRLESESMFGEIPAGSTVELGVSQHGVMQKPLTERKIGKIQIQLFDQGFPNAIKEISKVMTWAGENKGYLPHDWKNLPDAQNVLQGAASRHRNESLIQLVNNVSPIDRIDDESKLLHKAHEAFNVLAELELVLTGRIH